MENFFFLGQFFWCYCSLRSQQHAPRCTEIMQSMISRRGSRVFCEPCSQKTPRGILSVNSNFFGYCEPKLFYKIRNSFTCISKLAMKFPSALYLLQSDLQYLFSSAPRPGDDPHSISGTLSRLHHNAGSPALQ